MDFYEEIEKLIALCSDSNTGWEDDKGDWHDLAHEIEEFLAENISADYSSVESITAFSSPGCDAGVICCAWVNEGVLETYNIPWVKA